MMCKNILVLEDDGKRITTFIEFLGRHHLSIVDTVSEAKELLIHTQFDLVFLNNKGESLAIFIKQFLYYEPIIVVHTINDLLGENIRSILPEAKLLNYNSEEFYSVGEDLW